MNADEIRQAFKVIAGKASDTEVAHIISKLGDLFYDQFTILRTNQETFIQDVKNLREEFQQLSTLVLERLQNNETHYAERVELFVDRAHNLSNRYMIVEDKVDELAQYLDLSMQELKELLAQILGARHDT